VGRTTTINSDGWPRSIHSSLRSAFASDVSIINTGAEASFTTSAAATSVIFSSNRNGASQRLTGAAAIQTAGGATAEPQNAVSDTRDAPEIGNRRPASPVETIAPVTDRPKPPSRPDKVELTIDSLQNYELLKPIRVIVESLGDKVFVAEAPDLNVSTTGNSIGRCAHPAEG
jgi:hypothetical protein